MTVTVVAVLTARPGRVEDVLSAFREVSPQVHAEPGCELYAAHRQQDGYSVVMVERWATREDLDAHATGAPLALLSRLMGDALERPYDVWFLDAVPLGDPAKGVVPEVRV